MVAPKGTRVIDPTLPCKKCAGDPEAKGHRLECPQWVPFGGKAGRPKGDKKPKSAKGSGVYVAPLTQYMGMLGTMAYGAGIARQSPQLAYDGQVILAGAAGWAEAMQHLADENPNVAKVLDLLVTTSAWAEVTTATLAIAVPILASHGVLPAGAVDMFGIGRPPEVIAEPDPAANGHGPMFDPGEVNLGDIRDAEGQMAGGGEPSGPGPGGGAVPPMG